MVGNRRGRRGRAPADLPARPRGAAPGTAPDTVRPWLFAIARNRCKTILAARRPVAVSGRGRRAVASTASPTTSRCAPTCASSSADLGRLPEDQRARAGPLRARRPVAGRDRRRRSACPPGKVKALVFQARTELMAERDARSTPCADDPRGARGRARRRPATRAAAPPPRSHCEPCQAYRAAVATQRAGFALILPGRPGARPQGRACWPPSPARRARGADRRRWRGRSGRRRGRRRRGVRRLRAAAARARRRRAARRAAAARGARPALAASGAAPAAGGFGGLGGAASTAVRRPGFGGCVRSWPWRSVLVGGVGARRYQRPSIGRRSRPA